MRSFSLGNCRKSLGARSGDYGGCLIDSKPTCSKSRVSSKYTLAGTGLYLSSISLNILALILRENFYTVLEKQSRHCLKKFLFHANVLFVMGTVRSH